MRIGVDTGGTFTDCVVLAGSEVKVLKVFSTPEDAARAILEGVRRLEGAIPQRPAVKRPLEIIHGTTVGTNSLLERRGARVALVTTEGFEDLIEIGRQNRPRLYDFNVRRDPPLVARAFRFGVKERVGAGGEILARPAAAELQLLRARIQRSRAESIALCFLFSFANPTNERRVARTLRDLGLPLSVSHEILPEFREYERLSTVLINAYLAPRLGIYLGRLERALGTRKSKVGTGSRERGNRRPSRAWSFELRISNFKFPARRARVFVMQSSGGITRAARAAREPVRTILSGPAGGVVASAWLARELGIRRVISFDMGGTSTDVCLIDGAPRTTRETTLAGLPVAVPVLDVHSVGAGGGSLARIDAGGALRVGPESAGAAPGPICYGRGGQLPTVTDANLLLGRLDADYFLGGTFRLDVKAAEDAFAEFLRRHPRRTAVGPLPQSSLELARGIIAVANATMERALRVISVERGHDPRDFAFVCFGGAGGLHAADLARALGMPQVIVPRSPGAFSAFGILLSDIVKDVSQSVLLPVPAVAPGFSLARRPNRAVTLPAESPPGAVRPRTRGSRLWTRFLRDLERRFQALEHAARVELRKEGFPTHRARAEHRLDVRYVGQAYELSVPFTARFPEHFHQEHEKAYGHAQPGRPLEIVNLRLRLTIETPKPRFRTGERKPEAQELAASAVVKEKRVWFGGRFWKTPIYEREGLAPGMSLAGPAVVVEYSSTTVVPLDYICRVDEQLNLILARREESASRLT